MITSSKRSEKNPAQGGGGRETVAFPKWHFESFSFLKPKFAFEGAMREGGSGGGGGRVVSRESPHLSSATCYRVT